MRTRVLGAVLGAAIGDALGHPTEFFSSDAALKAKFGPLGVTGFELWWERDGERFAPYTDDTQMAEIVFRALLQNGGAAAEFETLMTEIAGGFALWSKAPQGGHRAPGNSCMKGSFRLASGVAWRDGGGPADGGCGSVMRAYPFGIFVYHDFEQAEHWAVEHSRMTHQAPIALAACAAMAVGMARMMQGHAPTVVLPAMIEAAGRHDAGTGKMTERAALDGFGDADAGVVLEQLQGWAAHEAIAAAVFLVARHPEDIRAALLAGANAPGDSDSIATLAGALLGARLGFDSLPSDWVRDVERSGELLALGNAAADLLAPSC